MEHVQVHTLKCKLMAFLVHLDCTADYFRKSKSTNAWITSNIYALAATVPNDNSYFTGGGLEPPKCWSLPPWLPNTFLSGRA